MSELKPFYMDHDHKAQLRAWGLSEMMRGGLYGLLFMLAIGAFFLVLWVIGLLLPPESKTAPGPMPYSQIEAPLAPTRIG